MSAARARNLVELNQRPRARRRAAAALHPLRDRRARRPDDGRAGRGRGLDHPARAEVARGRHPPGARHPAPERGHHHRHDQGERAGADRVRRLVADRLARDPRPERRGVAARPGRHALPARPPSRAPRASRAPSSTEEEIERLTDHWRAPGRARAAGGAARGGRDARTTTATATTSTRTHDDLLGEAIATVVQMGTASTSMLQRRLRVGYTRAGRLIDMMERRGVISGYEGSKARQVLITEARPAARPGGARRAGRRRRRRPASRRADDSATRHVQLAGRCAE